MKSLARLYKYAQLQLFAFSESMHLQDDITAEHIQEATFSIYRNTGIILVLGLSLIVLIGHTFQPLAGNDILWTLLVFSISIELVEIGIKLINAKPQRLVAKATKSINNSCTNDIDKCEDTNNFKLELLIHFFALVYIFCLYGFIALVITNHPGLWWSLPLTIVMGLHIARFMLAQVALKAIIDNSSPISNLELANKLYRVADKAGFPYIDLRESNESLTKYACGIVNTRKDAVVIFSPIALNSCTDTELMAILAHELAHRKHRDFEISSIFKSSINLTAWLITAAIIHSYFTATGELFLTLCAIYIGRVLISHITSILYGAFSRCLEQRCDRYSVELLQEGENLARGLEKLSEAQKHPKIPNSILGIYATHPHYVDRVAKIRVLDRKLQNSIS